MRIILILLPIYYYFIRIRKLMTYGTIPIIIFLIDNYTSGV